MAETFTWEGEGRRGFNTIKIYLLRKSIFDFRKNNLVSSGNVAMTVFEAATSGKSGMLAYVSEIMKDVKEKKGAIKWFKKDSPSLWTYTDDSTDDDGKWILDRTIERLKLADFECLTIFAGCSFSEKLSP